MTPLPLGVPIIAAPMAGGASTPALVIAATRSGGFGFLAAGYVSPDTLATQMEVVRSESEMFGVNVFVPEPVRVERSAYRAYARALQPEARRYGVTLPEEPVEDYDNFADKIDLLLAAPPPVVSFTFAIPPAAVIRSLQRAGALVILTVTSVAEARAARDAGADLLTVQGGAAGGHFATFTPLAAPPTTPLAELITRIRADTGLPLLAAGGIADPTDVTAVLQAGADAAVLGTALLRTDESGASALHKAALADPNRGDTVLTHAYTGRPARALPNEFIHLYDPIAPPGYPAVHHLTAPIRRAAAAAGDLARMHFWAGSGYHLARAVPAAQVFRELTAEL